MSPRCRRDAQTRRRALSTIVTLLTPPLVLAGCTSASTDRPESAPSRSVTHTDSKLDLSRLPIPRAEICDLLSDDGVSEALGGKLADTHHYGNGDEVEVRPGLVDVSHEYGCVFEGKDGAAARVWVFARPVARSEARTLVRRARRGRDCAFPKPVGFGSPGLNSVCELPTRTEEQPSTTVRARLEGLFGDTWVGCEVSEPLEGATGARADVLQRAVSWCTEVVTTVGARP